MGAGSAKGLRKSVSADDVDQNSENSDGHWDVDGKSVIGSPVKRPVDANKRSKSFDIHPSNPTNSEFHGQNTPIPTKKEMSKKKLFSFRRDRKDSEEKHDEDSDSDTNHRKESQHSRFKFFGNRKKEKKDEKLDDEINDIERTFESLGIIGKSTWNDGQDIKPKQKSKDDIDALEPMRNKSNVRIARPPRGINGLTIGNELYKRNDGDLSSTASSKKRFNFSWEADGPRAAPKNVDEWNYQAVSYQTLYIYINDI